MSRCLTAFSKMPHFVGPVMGQSLSPLPSPSNVCRQEAIVIKLLLKLTTVILLFRHSIVSYHLGPLASTWPPCEYLTNSLQAPGAASVLTTLLVPGPGYPSIYYTILLCAIIVFKSKYTKYPNTFRRLSTLLAIFMCVCD